ncbi:MAG TPA: RNase adapter RapZ [Acidimicrobiales bacterium]|nr:RNase adapter RapZ [Acidimicrobiales bacterium]
MSEFLIITGMSGAGRTTAADTLDDLDWFVIDNMPIELVGKVAELVGRPGSETERVALVIGREAGDDVEHLAEAMAQLKRHGARVRTLFLDAADDVLVRRFENNRRRHPLHGESLGGNIADERARLTPVRDIADVVMDTSELNVHQLRDRLVELFGRDDPSAMQTALVSFGYKHGMPLDADLVFDCRFLPNPHWIDELRPLTGLDEPVREYVLGQPETKQFLDKLDDLLVFLLPNYVNEGKSYLTIAIGCTGGHHRSVVLAEEVADTLRRNGFDPAVMHRDVSK